MTASASALKLADRAEAASRVLPPLLVEAERLAASVILGDHGRKRAGPGESFWQYRPYSFGDSTQRIDWHKSARSDRVFIRENEWEAANTLWLWTSPHASMEFRSHLAPLNKRERAQVLTLAIGSLAVRAHERIGVLDGPFQPDHSRAQLLRVANWILEAKGKALPVAARTPRFSSALLVSDFFDPIAEIAASLTPLATAGIKGHLVQVVDPAEETCPIGAGSSSRKSRASSSSSRPRPRRCARPMAKSSKPTARHWATSASGSAGASPCTAPASRPRAC